MRGATLRLRRGERINIYGPPGSGKTILLLSLIDIVVRDAGTVQIGGMDPLNHRAEILRETCFIPARIRGSWEARLYLSLYTSLYRYEPQFEVDMLSRDILLRLNLERGPSLVVIDGVDRLEKESRELLNNYLERENPTLITASREPDIGTRYDYRGYMEAGNLDIFPVV